MVSFKLHHQMEYFVEEHTKSDICLLGLRQGQMIYFIDFLKEWHDLSNCTLNVYSERFCPVIVAV